jgi:signal transduction histidine kinase
MKFPRARKREAMATPLKALIVENSENDALLIADSLAQSGYAPDWQRVETAPQLTAALDSARAWDLVISDYSMPGFSGLHALAIYQRFGLDIPFLLVSGSIGEERAVEAMRSGVHDYIMKDRMQRLGPAVERELREAANRRERRKTMFENQRLNSQLLQLNDELRDKVDQLSRSHADLEQVTWAASHDLKEPVRIITTYSQLLLRQRPATTADEVEFAGYITDGAQRVTALLDGLLAYSRNLRAPADLSVHADAEKAARTAISHLASFIEERGAVIVVDALPSVGMEMEALVDVFAQLFLNAMSYSREGVPPRVHVGSTRSRNEIRVSVQDNGIGIKPEHQARIFELFRRLHGTESPGIGLGLPLSRRLIENYGGRLWLESQPGVGSTFHFTLAAVDKVSAATC